MRVPRLRTTIKPVGAILCAACFLTMSLGSVSRAIAADPWETWPKKTTVPGVAPNPETDANGSAKAEEAAAKEAAAKETAAKETEAKETEAKETAKGKSSGTVWWIAAGTAVVIGIGIAIAAGGGGGGGSVSTNPGHQ